MCLCACMRLCVCVCVCGLIRTCLMRAKHGARQEREGRPFKTRGLVVTDKPLAAHLAFCNHERVCVHMNVQLTRECVPTRIHELWNCDMVFFFLSRLCEFYMRKEVYRKNRYWTRKYSDNCAGAVLTQADSEFTSQPCFCFFVFLRLRLKSQ